jgi:hypothetical protein
VHVYHTGNEHFQFSLSSLLVCLYIVLVQWLPCASREKDNKRFAIVVTAVWCQKERTLPSFFFSLYLHIPFIHSFFGINPQSHFPLASIPPSHTVNWPLYAYVRSCTAVYRLSLCFVLWSFVRISFFIISLSLQCWSLAVNLNEHNKRKT